MVAFATQVKRRRGTTAQNDAFTGAEGEIVVDTQKHTLRVHDGATQGGFEMARQTDLDDKADTSYIDDQLVSKADTDLGNIPANYDYVVESQLPTADNGYTWYRKYKSGWVEQGGVGITADASLAFSATFPIVMADTNYTILAISKTPSSTTTSTPHGCHYLSKTTTRCNIISLAGNSGNWVAAEVCWQVSGISAQ